MIATHSPKFFNARLSVHAICADIISNIPSHLICSKTINMRKKYFACPSNAAEFKKYREEIEKISNQTNISCVIPDITDPFLKQLLLPVNDDYVSVTPVISNGVLYEFYKRSYESEAPFYSTIVQPNVSALANHGEGVLLQGGKVRLMRRGIVDTGNASGWKGDFIELACKCVNMNISSGMLSIGFPAITAIGGFIHSIERKVGCEIEFSVGVKSSSWSSAVIKATTIRNGTKNYDGRVATKGAALFPVPSLVTGEVKGTVELVILMRGADTALIKETLKSTNKIAGGDVFDLKISEHKTASPPKCNYLYDASNEMQESLFDGAIDSLAAAMTLYAKDGEYNKYKRWSANGNGRTLIHCGYAYLEKPTPKSGVRGNYRHAWAEPVFSLINQGAMSDRAWWRRVSTNSGVFWRGC
ncbi:MULTISPECIES: type I-F CRISPR-associated protein Csy2 [Providencia]|uniref:type I-F CRISPR-associated protein Csy2 n=1 Tax=Providencia TaxID=586 RepID=UPI002349AA5C|nr:MULTISPECIES: type I-F CRISPR-associated protein Csy2 [unclassified Providencia]